MTKWTGWALVVVLFFLPRFAIAQELIENGAFDTDIGGWNILFGRNAVWDSRDSDDASGSGSVLLTHQGPGNGATQLILGQCVPINTSQEYRFGAMGLVPLGQGDVNGSARIFIDTYASSDCSGETLIFFSDDSGIGPSDEWQEISGSYVGEVGTQSARVALGISKSSGVNADTFGLFDDVFFGSFRFEVRSIEGIWVNPSETSGQGLMFDYGPSFGQAFVAWFTDLLDSVEPGEAQGRRLLTALMLVDGNRFNGPLRVNEDDGAGGQVVRDIGLIDVEMTACDEGQVRLELIDPVQTIEFDIVPLEQQVNPSGFICESMEDDT